MYYFSNNNEIRYLKELTIDYNKILKLILKGDGIENLKFLENINLMELKEIYLNNNKISDIEILKKVKFDKLEILNLGYNNISNISILEYVNFKELKELNLEYNKISDIEVLKKVKFDKLEILNLKNNNILNKKSSIINYLQSNIHLIL